MQRRDARAAKDFKASDVIRDKLAAMGFAIKDMALTIPEEAIVPQGGRWPSRVLGLDLALEGRRVRFFHGSAALPEASELIQRLEGMMDGLTSGKETAERAREESERAREEAEQRAERLAAKLRELGVDPDAV